MNTPSSTSNKVFCVSNSEAATLAPPVTFEPLLNPAEGAKLLGIHAKILVKMARAKVIQAIRIGKHWRLRASSLNAHIEHQLQREPPTIGVSKSSPRPTQDWQNHRCRRSLGAFPGHKLRAPDVDRSPATVGQYPDNIRLHIIPNWGHMDLNATDMQNSQDVGTLYWSIGSKSI